MRVKTAPLDESGGLGADHVGQIRPLKRRPPKDRPPEVCFAEDRVRKVGPNEVRAGEVSKGVTVKDHRIIAIGKRVVEELPGARGPFAVQGFLTKEGSFLLTEINARFGGGHPLAIRAGADFPQWTIAMASSKPISIPPDEWKSGLVMLRYDEAVFVEEQAIQ